MIRSAEGSHSDHARRERAVIPGDPEPAPDPDRTLATDHAADAEALSRWGPLELLEKIGEGAFGETFRARDPWLDREVALKLLKPGASNAAAVEARVIREGVLLARVTHPHVVTVYGAERHANRVGMWMELVRGDTVRVWLGTRGRLEEREVALVGLDLCRALSAVHAAGIVHRDVKAENVMREHGGRIVLMDFGAGLDLQSAAAEDAALTGTPLYMAPELFLGRPASVRTDLYAVGVLLYNAATGEYPVWAQTLRELRDAHREGKVTPLSDRREDLSAELTGLVTRCLAPDPERRVATSEELERALAELLAAPDSDASRSSTAAFDFTAWRHARIAEWSRPRYRLDTDFVALTLLVDQGEESTTGRWQARPERYRDLRDLLASVEDPALVVLGPPGCGKSTLMRRLELDVAAAALEGAEDMVTFFVQLNHYPVPGRTDARTDPGEWLASRWRRRYPELPPLHDLLAQGRMLLLLDALNELPAPQASDLRDAVVLWKAFVERLVEEYPGNRVVFSCRALDYSAPLSTPRLRVPQIVIEPMTDEQVEQYLIKNAPETGAAIWKELAGTPQLEVMRSPYFLSLLLEQVEGSWGVPQGRAALFTGFIRRALKREIERDNPLFAADGLLTERDVRRVTRWQWRSPWELPERGILVPKLSGLAFAMQDESSDGGASQVRIGFDDALDFLADDRDEDIVRAGVALSVLDEDAANDQVLFFHQLLQEYFAGRKLGASPDPGRVRAPWKTADIEPPLRAVLTSLPGAETVPGLPTTGWEETSLLAAVMTGQPDEFTRGLMGSNLALAGRCAAEPEVRGRLSRDLLDDLRTALAGRSVDPDADLRARIQAGFALGQLGDPRFERRSGPHGDYLVPPMIEIAGGCYPLGEGEPFEYLGETIRSHTPRHEVEVLPFRVGRFPVTNAEWALFQESRGYDVERWWDTDAARRWRSGEGTADGIRAQVRHWLGVFRNDPRKLEAAWESGQMPEESYERWKKRFAMSEGELEIHLRELYPGGRFHEPLCWRDPVFNNPAQPVVGVSWFEARAYCNWLSAQTGQPFRLPTEAEWEAAARGRAGRAFAYGETFDALKGNTAETRLKRTTPVGVFPEGDTPETVSDLAGNVSQWTNSLFGPGVSFEEAPFAYPYRRDDGREDVGAGPGVRRVLRGGAWGSGEVSARAAFRDDDHPDNRFNENGFRLACPA